MARHGRLTLETGTDARQRIARLTDRARALLPLIEAEWAATSAAAELEAELPAALTEVLFQAERAVLSRAAVGVGGLVSAVLSGPVARVTRQGRGMLAGTMIWGAAIACFGLTASLPLALPMLAVAGAVAALTTPVISTVAGGLGCLAIAALVGLMFPAFARYRNQPAARGG
jgi:hypothetical protein